MINPVNDDRHTLVTYWDIRYYGKHSQDLLKRPILIPTDWDTTPVPIDKWSFKFLRGHAYDAIASNMHNDQILDFPVSTEDGYEGRFWSEEFYGFRICRNKS